MAKLERILVALDFSPHSKEALKYGLFLAEKVSATLDVLHVADPDDVRGTDDVAVLHRGVPGSTMEIFNEELVQRKLNDFLADTGFGRTVRNDEIEQSDEPADLIVKLARDRGYDLILMGTQGRTGLQRLVMGSVAQEVIQKSTCPVLVHRAPLPTSAK